MLNLYPIETKKEERKLKGLSKEEIASVYYHNIFDYPLNLSELIKWKLGIESSNHLNLKQVSNKKGFYFLTGREGLVYKRLLKEKISEKKLKIAKRVSKLISHLPTVKMIGVTGSLAMKNSDEVGDIDLFVITKKGSLWTTRLFVLLTLKLFRVKTRRFGDINQKDKICLNMWMDEGDLTWKSKDRNIYTAHEIAQIISLTNKNHVYEKFLEKNKWVLKYWPNAIKIRKINDEKKQKSFNSLIENLAYKLQYLYMKKKISREVITKTRALFHPQDWGRFVTERFLG